MRARERHHLSFPISVASGSFCRRSLPVSEMSQTILFVDSSSVSGYLQRTLPEIGKYYSKICLEHKLPHLMKETFLGALWLVLCILWTLPSAQAD